jgi:hypothetical protein
MIKKLNLYTTDAPFFLAEKDSLLNSEIKWKSLHIYSNINHKHENHTDDLI